MKHGPGIVLPGSMALTDPPPAPRSQCSAGGAHSWRIETPDGPTCGAHCKKCGADRNFKSGMDFYNEDFSFGGGQRR